MASHRRLVLVGAATLLCAVGVARWERVDSWHRAGGDTEAIVAAVVARIPDPDGMVVVGPAPVQEANVAAFLDRSNIEAALQVAYDDPAVTARMGFGDADFAAVDPDLRFDLRPVSELRDDTDG